VKRKVSSTILFRFQMNNVTASGLISPHYTCSPTLRLVSFYDVPPLKMVPQQVHLHGQWLGKDSTDVLPLDDQVVIPLA
jgi:hypothetical protein